MKKYIFVTPDGLSFKPNVDSPTPDFLDIEMFGQDSDASIQDAISQLIEYNENARQGSLDKPFTLRLERNNRNLWLRDNRTKICRAG
jgi:hypothetical protein